MRKKSKEKGGYQRKTPVKMQYRRPEKKIYNKFSISELTGDKFVREANEMIRRTLRKGGN
jgi:hypothetical protein